MFINFAQHSRRWWLSQKIEWLNLFNRHETMQAIYEAHLRVDPQDADAQFKLANLQIRTGQVDAGLHTLAALIAFAKANPQRVPKTELAQYLFNQGFVFERLKRDDEAMASMREAVTNHDYLDRAWYGMGLLHVKQARWPEAIAAFEKNTQLQPMSPYGWYQLSLAQQQVGNDAGAEKSYLTLHKFDPKTSMVLKKELLALRAAAASQ